MSYVVTLPGSVVAEACWTLNFSLIFLQSALIIGLVCSWLCVCFSSLLLINAPLPEPQLSCNYTTVCDVWMFERSNTVSILSQGSDLESVVSMKGHLLCFDATQYIYIFWNNFSSLCLSFFLFCLTCMYVEWASKMSLALSGDYWAEDSGWPRSRRWDKQARKQLRRKEIQEIMRVEQIFVWVYSWHK